MGLRVAKPDDGLRYSLVLYENKGISEMNVHSISTITGRTEMELLSSVEGNFMSPQSSNSNMKIVQDSLLAMYLMTKGWVKIEEDLFSNIVMNADGWESGFLSHKIKHIRNV
jgi:hypothetical protein